MNNAQIYLEQELQTSIIYSYDQETNLFNITISVARDYDLKSIYASLPEQILGTEILAIKVFINGKDIYIYFVSENMLKMANSVDPISSALIDGVNKCYSMLKVTFCSYFLMNIVNFYTLTLMYNFLGLHSQPIYSRIAL